MGDQKNNSATAVNNSEIIKKQIELLVNINDKLSNAINGFPLNLAICDAIRKNSETINCLLNALDPFS